MPQSSWIANKIKCYHRELSCRQLDYIIKPTTNITTSPNRLPYEW
jgi:hypothetical protein